MFRGYTSGPKSKCLPLKDNCCERHPEPQTSRYVTVIKTASSGELGFGKHER